MFCWLLIQRCSLRIMAVKTRKTALLADWRRLCAITAILLGIPMICTTSAFSTQNHPIVSARTLRNEFESYYFYPDVRKKQNIRPSPKVSSKNEPTIASPSLPLSVKSGKIRGNSRKDGPCAESKSTKTIKQMKSTPSSKAPTMTQHPAFVKNRKNENSKRNNCDESAAPTNPMLPSVSPTLSGPTRIPSTTAAPTPQGTDLPTRQQTMLPTLAIETNRPTGPAMTGSPTTLGAPSLPTLFQLFCSQQRRLRLHALLLSSPLKYLLLSCSLHRPRQLHRLR